MINSIFKNKTQIALTILLLLIFLIPTVFTIELNSFKTNDLVAYLVLGFSIIFAKATINSIFSFAKTHRVMTAIYVLLILFYAPSARWFNYVTALIFFFTLSGLFNDKDHAKAALKIKALTVFGVSIYFVWLFLFTDSLAYTTYLAKHSMPFYRHFRHFNYELFFAFSISCYLIFCHQTHYRRAVIALGIVALSFFSLSTAGRGQAVAMLCTLIAISPFIFKKKYSVELLYIGLAICIGFLLVFLLNQDSMLSFKGAQLTTENRTIDSVSSGRLTIWVRSIDYYLNQPFSLIVFGSMTESSRYVQNAGFNNIVQPHNVFVQLFLEYGVIGVLTLCYFYFRVSIKAFQLLKNSLVLDHKVVSAAILVGALVFAIFDGLFFHGLPLVTIAMLSAILFSNDAPAVPETHLLHQA